MLNEQTEHQLEENVNLLCLSQKILHASGMQKTQRNILFREQMPKLMNKDGCESMLKWLVF